MQASAKHSEEIVRQLGRIVSSTLFAKSQRLRSFLEFVVRMAVAGDEGQLKEYVIGREVFERGPAYNPQEDPIVRIMAGRLRGKLAEYYQTEGRHDPVILDLPRGGYVPVFRLREAAIAAPSAPTQGAPVGRSEELARLHAAFDTASSAGGRAVTVSGDAGMGKTTLVNQFISQLAAPVWVASGSCSERLAANYAFVPVLECLDGLLHDDSSEAVRALLTSAAPTWLAQVTGMTASPEALSHERMRREFVHLFRELSRARPVVLFLDDLHWADASTCDLLAYLGQRMADIRILVVLSYRPVEVLSVAHPFLSVKLRLERAGVSQDIPLSVLRRQDVAAYVQGEFPGNRFAAEFIDVVHARTEGNPLFMTDLLRYARETGILTDDGGGWRMTQALDEIATVIPAGVESMIRLAVQQLSADERRILECAAAQGVLFDSWVVAQALDMDAGLVEERLRDLALRHRLVQAVTESQALDQNPSVRYRFVHVFYQNALYASLGPSRRVERSLRVAKILVGLAGSGKAANTADLAILFERGRDARNAARYFLEAARAAAAVFAYPEAVLLCNRGLHALQSLPESPERDKQELIFSLTLAMSQMVTCGYAAPEVERTHLRSRQLCEKSGERRRLVRVLWGLHTCRVNAGDLPAALALAEEMRALAGELRTPVAEIESLHAYGTTLAFMGRLAPAREALERIFTIAPPGHPALSSPLYLLDPGVTSASMLARLLALMGSVPEAVVMAEGSVELATRLGHPYSLTYATFWVGWIQHALGEHTRACQTLEAGVNLCRTHDLPQILEWARVVLGAALAGAGDLDQGISLMRASLDNQRAMGCYLERPFCLTLLAEATIRTGDTGEAIRLCDEALALADRTEGRSYEAETHRVRGEAIRASGADPEAEFRTALDCARKAGCELLALRADQSSRRWRRRES